MTECSGLKMTHCCGNALIIILSLNVFHENCSRNVELYLNKHKEMPAICLPNECDQSIRCSGSTYSEGGRKHSFLIVCLNWPKRWVPFTAVKVISLFPSGNFEKALKWQETQSVQSGHLGGWRNKLPKLCTGTRRGNIPYCRCFCDSGFDKQILFFNFECHKMSNKNMHIVQLAGNYSQKVD